MSNVLPFADLEETARKIRTKLLAMHYEAKANHLGGGLSAVEILTYVYCRWKRPQDQFILSKGHAASALYATLWALHSLSESQIQSYYRDGTKFPAHPAPRAHAEIPAATGSLGHGLPIGAGMAYAHQYLNGTDVRIACLLSDGECNEGSVWEAALFAAHHHLHNLTVLIDANGFQGFGPNQEVLNLESFSRKWEAFGFAVSEINGHDFAQLDTALGKQAGAALYTQPRCILCRTVKGKGVSFMENTMEWHYLTMTPEQYQKALVEVDGGTGAAAFDRAA